MKKSFPHGLYAHLLAGCFFQSYHVFSMAELLSVESIGLATEQEVRASLTYLQKHKLIDCQRLYNAPQWLAIKLMRSQPSEEVA